MPDNLKLYSDVKRIPVKWLWYPYIPYGKITLIQGDPGEGKSTLVMNIIAALSAGTKTPDGVDIKEPVKTIYQCSEDGIADTIKPRLEKAGAVCENIAFIDENENPLSLSNDCFRDAIAEFNAKVLVIDPFQAYIGEGTSMFDAGSVRKLMHRLCIWASAYDCAIILVGHLNKKESSRALYRGLGSVDVVASARSVLHVGRGDDENIRIVKQVKNSLAPLAPEAMFEFCPINGIRWVECKKIDNENDTQFAHSTTQEKASHDLIEMLESGPIKATEIEEYFINAGISMRTVYKTKTIMGIKSIKRGGVWYWKLDNKNGKQ